MGIKEKASTQLQDTIKRHKELVEQMGGYEAVQKRLDLSKVMFITYRNRGNSAAEITESVLNEFRDKVSKYGYSGIDKNMIPVVEHYGTTKDKVALIVNAHFDMKRDKETPLLSRKQADAIKAEVKTHGRGEMVKFMNYLSLHDTLRFILPHFYRTKYAYLAMAYQSTIYFQTYEWLGKAEELFNRFSPLVDPDKQAEFRQLAADYDSYLHRYQMFGELEEKSGEGWIDKQREDCLNYAVLLTTKFAKRKLSQIKGFIEAIERWTKDNGAEMFISMELRDQIFYFKKEDIMELHDKYYFSHLSYMEKRGETPTDADRKIAIFPEYEEVERSEEAYKFIYSKLDENKETYK